MPTYEIIAANGTWLGTVAYYGQAIERQIANPGSIIVVVHAHALLVDA